MAHKFYKQGCISVADVIANHEALGITDNRRVKYGLLPYLVLFLLFFFFPSLTFIWICDSQSTVGFEIVKFFTL